MIKVAIVEDEQKCQNQIADYLNKYSKEKNVEISFAIFSNGLDFVENFHSNFDVIFFDIEMPLMNGMEAAKKIRQKDENVEIVFITFLTNYAIEGYSVDAFDYVLKPINYLSFVVKLTRLIEKLKTKESKSYLFSLKAGEKINLKRDSILYFESNDHYVTIVTTNEKYEIRNTIKNIVNDLNDSSFIQCGKSYLINMRHISSIIGNVVYIDNKEQLPISRAYSKTFIQEFTKFFASGRSL